MTPFEDSNGEPLEPQARVRPAHHLFPHPDDLGTVVRLDDDDEDGWNVRVIWDDGEVETCWPSRRGDGYAVIGDLERVS